MGNVAPSPKNEPAVSASRAGTPAGLEVPNLEKLNLFIALAVLIGCAADTRGLAVAADEAPKCAGNTVSVAAPAAVWVPGVVVVPGDASGGPTPLFFS